MHSDQLMINQQIVHAFEELKLSAEQIAEQFDKDVLAVKAVLMSSSGVYRRIATPDVDYNLTDQEALEAKNTLVRLMRHSEDEHLQFKVARYILDDKKGRLDIGKILGNVRMDVTVFNQYLNDARESLDTSRGRPEPAPAEKQLIDV